MTYFLVVCIGEGWWRWTFGVGFLLKNSVSKKIPYSKFVSTRAGVRGDPPNVDRCGQEGRRSKMTENVRTSFMEGPMPVCQSEIKLKF